MGNMERIIPQTTKPLIPPTPPTPSIAPGRPTIISGVPNPLTHVASDIRNSLFGRGSLSSGSAHIGSIQNNITRALSVSNQFSNKPAQISLMAAQQSLSQAASAKDSATRNAALAQARQYMIRANNEMSSLGYGKAIGQATPINPSAQLAPSNRRIFL